MKLISLFISILVYFSSVAHAERVSPDVQTCIKSQIKSQIDFTHDMNMTTVQAVLHDDKDVDYVIATEDEGSISFRIFVMIAEGAVSKAIMQIPGLEYKIVNLEVCFQ